MLGDKHAHFKIESAECCGSHHLKVLNSHESTAFYECKKCGKQFHGPRKVAPTERNLPEPTYQSSHPKRKWDGGRKLG